MSTAITKASAAGLTSAVEINGIGDVLALSAELAKAQGFVPRAYVGKSESIAAAILTGIELGIGPMEALRVLHIIEGKPTMSAEFMLARAIRAGVRPQWLQQDATCAHVRLSRDGFEPHEHRFTMDEAKSAGVTNKDNWRRYPAAMLRARCISAAMRAFCPDVLGACVYATEELDEVEDAPSNPHTASAHRHDEDVIDGASAATKLRDDSRALRDAWAGSLAHLEEAGTADELEAWSYAHGHAFDSELRGSDRSWVYRRLLKCATRNEVSDTQLKAWLAAKHRDATPAREPTAIPEEYDGMFAELATITDADVLRAWVEGYLPDLHSLRGDAKREAWRLITEAAASAEVDAATVKEWMNT